MAPAAFFWEVRWKTYLPPEEFYFHVPMCWNLVKGGTLTLNGEGNLTLVV